MRQALLEKQGGLCAVCMKAPVVPCLDHDHGTGKIRGVLCRGCNLFEGTIFNKHRRCQVTDLPSWLRQLATYYDQHRQNPSTSIHPTYLTQDEKIERRKRINKSRRKKPKET